MFLVKALTKEGSHGFKVVLVYEPTSSVLINQFHQKKIMKHYFPLV